MNKLNSQQEYNENDILVSINKQLETTKEGYSDPLDGVLTYNNKGICTTFFSGEKEITLNDIQQKEQEIKDKIQALEKLFNDVNESPIQPNLKWIYLNSILWVKNKFKMFQSAIRLEASKSWYILDEKIKQEKTTEVTHLQEKIYGARVSNTPEERNVIMQRLLEKFEKNKNKLTDQEQSTYQRFLNTIEQKYGTIKKNTTNENDTEDQIKDESDLIKKHKNDKVISKEKLKEYSNKILNIYKTHFIKNNNIPNPNRKADIDPEKKALYLSSKENLAIPESYENITKEKFTKVVIGHEIEQHLLWRNNTNRLLGEWFMGNWYDLLSEWVAKINESIASWEINGLEDLEKLKEKPGLWIIGIFVCENYNYEDSVEILRIFHKLGKRKDEAECLKKATDMVKRRKRFFDYSLPGSSIKDTLYDRGKNRVIDYITKDKDIKTAVWKYKDLNFGKLWKEELEIIPELKKELWINDTQVLQTLMISRILNDKLTKGKWSAREYSNPLGMKKLDISTKRQLIEVLKDINSLESPSQIT